LISKVAEIVSWKLAGVVQKEGVVEVKERGAMKKGRSAEEVGEEQQMVKPVLPPVLQLELQGFGHHHS
jgi:hypothetical protein